MTTPLVSICIPTYNGRAFLRQCLESALAQTMVDCEIVVLDDASQDGTVEIAGEYALRDPRVRLYRNRENLGSVQNRNRCIELARGEWIKLLFQDNYLEPHCVASGLGALPPGVSLAVFKRRHIVEPGVPTDLREGFERYVTEHNLPRRFAGCSLIRPDAFAAHVAHYPTYNCIGEPTATLIHRSAFQRFGFFHPYLIGLNDWEYAARVAVHTGLCYIDEPLVTIRLHANSTTARNHAWRRYRANVIDPLVILHELVYHEAYAPVRTAARHCRPRINLRHHLTYAARQARRQARREHASGAGAEALAAWEDAVTQYPRLLALSPGYVLSAAWSRATGGLRRLRGKVAQPSLRTTRMADGLAPARWTWEIETARPLGPAAESFLDALDAAARPRHPRSEGASGSERETGNGPIDALTALLIGTSDDRFGPRMGPEDRSLVRTHVSYWVEAGQPVHLLVMWGGLKHYVPDEDQGIDLAEFFAVQQFQRLARHAGALYPPGVVILFCLEDFGVWYEDACGYGWPARQSVERSIAKYLGEFEALLRTAGADWARPLRFQDLVGHPFDRTAYVHQADRNLDLLRAYWAESAACTAEDAASLDSYRALAAAGWAGQISPEMREHYRKRLTRLYPGASPGERVDRLLRYFAMVLLYQQLRVFAGLGGPLIKISMYKPAPGLPGERVTGRIHLRCLPRRLTSHVMPPWTCKGCFRINRDGTVAAALQSFPLAWQERLRFDRGWLWVAKGRDRIRVRADVLLPDAMEGGSPLRLKEYG